MANDTIQNLVFAQVNLQARYNFNHWFGVGLGFAGAVQYSGPQNASDNNAVFFGPFADLNIGNMYTNLSGGLRFNAFYSPELLDRQQIWMMVPEIYTLYRF